MNRRSDRGNRLRLIADAMEEQFGEQFIVMLDPNTKTVILSRNPTLRVTGDMRSYFNGLCAGIEIGEKLSE